MRLQEAKYFKIELGEHTLEYEIVSDDIELLISSKATMGIMIKDFQVMVNSIKDYTHTDINTLKQAINKSCIDIIEVFLGAGSYANIRKDLMVFKKKTLTTSEHIEIVRELLMLVQLNRSSSVIEEIREVMQYD